MAKITTIKFEIKEKPYSININCDSSGNFKCNLPEEVAQALNLHAKLSASTLVLLETQVQDAIKRYKSAETIQDLFLLIRYGASGHYNSNSEGLPLFGGYRNKYELEFSMSSSGMDALGFQFDIAIRETIDGAENWFYAQLGKEILRYEENGLDPDKYYKCNYTTREKVYHHEDYKKIPFSPEALATLNAAQETIRKASEMLFNFIEKDVQQIEQMLINQKLIS